MPLISKETVNEVNDRLDAIAVANDYVRLEKRSGRFWGLCPFHNEKTPSFTVDPDRKMYHCFGCGQGGGIISFVMEMDKISFPEAVETLAKRFGVEIVYDKSAGPVPQDGRTKTNEALFELYDRICTSFHHFLVKNPEGAAALRYTTNRMISNEMIETFRLGFSPRDRNWLYGFLSKKGYSAEFLAESGLFSEKYPKSSFFSNRLMFPITDSRGRVVAFGARLLEGEGPKYVNSRESGIYKKGQNLFALHRAIPAIRQTKTVYLAEGYMDVIALHQAGITNAAAPLGTAFTDDQAKLLRRWADKVCLVFDSDSAGQTAAYKGILTCRRASLACEVIIPDGAAGLKDPADILKDFGPEALQKSIKCVINDFDYLLRRGRALFDISTSGGKTQAVAFLFPYLEALDSDVSRDSCIASIADAYGVDSRAVASDYSRRNREKPWGKARTEQARPKTIRMNEELSLLAVVSVNMELYPRFRSRLTIQEIDDPDAKELFVALEECYIHEETGMEMLLARIGDGPLRNFVLEKGSSREFSLDPETLIEDGIRRVKRKRLKRRLAEIVSRLRAAEGPGAEELLTEKKYLDAELRQLEGRQE